MAEIVDKVKHNIKKVGMGLNDWWMALKDTYDDMGEALDDRKVGEFFHLIVRIVNDTIKLPHRLWTYAAVFAFFVWVGSLFGLYAFPVSWTGFF